MHFLSKIIVLLLPFASLACGTTIAAPPTDRIVCFVHGAGGDIGYGGLKSGLTEGGITDLRAFHWGSAVFPLNFQTTEIHDAGEKELAAHITEWLHQKPSCQIDLVCHSAGGGVVLGAVGRLDPSLHVHNVVLLAPSVSPGYNLVPPLSRVTGHIHLFYSSDDIVFLKWRTGTFGTYDNVKTPAAGHLGFKPEPPLPTDLAAKLVQHPYDPAWRDLGDDGSHIGTIGHDFNHAVVAPLLNAK